MDHAPASLAHESDLVLSIVRNVRRRVAEGTWAKGSHLPTRSELATLFATSPSTVQAAIRVLTTEGSVITRKRAGTCIAATAPEYGRFALVLADHGVTPRPGSGLFHDQVLRVASRIPSLHPGWRLEAWTADDPSLHALVRAGGLDGILYIGAPEKLPQVAGTGVPLACFHYDGAPWYGDVNLTSNKRAFFATCTQVLVKKERLSIGVIDSDLHDLSAPAGVHLRRAAQAISDIIHEHGGTCQPAWVQSVDARRSVAAYQAALLLLSGGSQRPAALILTDDHLLPAVREAARDLALDIPGHIEICVLGYDPRDVRTDGCNRVGFDIEHVLLQTLERLARCRQGHVSDKDLPCQYRDVTQLSRRSRRSA